MDRFEAVITIVLGLTVSLIGSLIHVDRSQKLFKKLLILLCIIIILLILVILPYNHQTGIDKEQKNIQAVLNNRGYVSYILGDFNDSIIYYEEALKIDPEYELAKNNKIDALRRLFN